MQSLILDLTCFVTPLKLLLPFGQEPFHGLQVPVASCIIMVMFTTLQLMGLAAFPL